jgi:hypothetical protein
VRAVGFVDRVELHGERYEVQTELVDPDEGRVRSAIFHSGRVVAVNEVWLRKDAARLASDPDAVGAMVARHHRHVVDGFVGRTRSFLERLRSGPPQAPAPPPPAALPSAEAAPDMPPFPEDPALADGVDLRRLYGELRLRVAGHPSSPPAEGAAHGAAPARAADLCARLDRAIGALAWAVEQPRFRRARLDEQARFHLLRDRIEAWTRYGRNPEEAEWIWTEIVVFCDYVSEISHRFELVEFDRQLVSWGFRALDLHGPTRATLKPLEWLFGRDPGLDALLAAPDGAGAEAWTEALRRVWCRLGAG